MNSYRKAKAVAKVVNTKSPKLETQVLSTMKTISDIVGATLGPSGCPVLIERQEYGMPNILTKDGVTVFRHLGFQDPTAQAIMETARDAATRTVAEAGDGTTTATVLAEAIVRHTYEFINNNPKISAQKVFRTLEKAFNSHIDPFITSVSLKPDEGMLYSVAKLSANGDEELAKHVIDCFNMVGDDGNISIIEQNGKSHYEVEVIKGFPVNTGFVECVGSVFNMFLNDKGNNRVFMEKPAFLLYNGTITNIQTIQIFMEEIAQAWASPEVYGLDKPFTPNIVIVANGFSESVIGQLGLNFSVDRTINVYPMTSPRTQALNSQPDFLYDLAAVTGSKVFDPVTAPIDTARLQDLGYGVQSFEATRYRSTILGICDEDLIVARAEEVKRGYNGAESKLDLSMLEERVGRLVGGIARLKIFGASSSELREKRDRAEDAICAVRGAKQHGCLPGGGWTLKKIETYVHGLISKDFFNKEEDIILLDVLLPSLREPLYRIFKNCGMNSEESEQATDAIGKLNRYDVYDAWNYEVVDAIKGHILDATPAVRESLRASLSIGTSLGTLGGVIVYARDEELERAEASDTNNFMKSYNG